MPIMNDYKRMPLISSGEWKGGEPETCTWTQYHNVDIGYYCYLTSCKNYHSFKLDKLPFSSNGFNFCPYCGKPIKDIPYSG